MTSIRDFIREHANDTIEVHANIDSYDYINQDDVYATVTADMTDDEIKELCEKVCDEYVEDMKEEWYRDSSERYVSHRAPRVWLRADGDEFTVYDEEDVEPEDSYWFAIQMDREDTDWGTGSYDLDEAMAKAADNGARYIAVIDETDDPICIDMIEL